MSITAVVTTYVKFTGDQTLDFVFTSGEGELIDSVCYQQPISLGIGNNAFSVPAITGLTTHGVVIVPPDGNIEEPILKGAFATDVGITLSATQATVIQFGATPPSILNFEMVAAVDGFRLIWF